MDKKILTQLNNATVVSFDIFDTLVFRNVKTPDVVFEIIEKKLKDRGLIDSNIEFPELRKAAQMLAYEQATKEEITLQDIYDQLQVFDKDTCNAIMALEIETELDLVTCNNEAFEIYNYCVEHNKQIAIISDMYLPKSVILKILHKCNYYHIDYLFVSSEEKARKSTGHLYKKALDKIQQDKRKIVHIGDNYKSDYLLAKWSGINAIHYSANSLYNLQPSDSNLDRIAYNYYPQNENAYFKLGFSYLGGVLYQFCNWLKLEKEKHGIEKLFFLSREGLFLKRCYETCFKCEDVDYICVSRKSIRNASLSLIDSPSDLIKATEPRVNESLEVFFDKCGLKIDEYQELLRKYNLTKASTVKDNNIMHDLIRDLSPALMKQSQNQLSLLTDYLHNHGFFTPNSAIVDIGWKGSMQNTLNRLFCDNQPKVGFYFGKIKSHYIQKAYGFINNYDEEIEAGTMLFETMFMPDHGTTLMYEAKENGVIPVMSKVEFSYNDINKIQSIQNGVIAYLEIASNLNINDAILSDQLPVKRLMNLAIDPGKKEIMLLGKLPYYDSFVSSLICDHNIKNIKQNLIKSGWKIGYLKSVLRVKGIPYLKLYQLLKRRGK